MQIDLKTLAIEPLRPAYDHLVKRFGNKPATRYQEASYDLQAEEQLHYRPTWDPAHALYDKSWSKIVMQDWQALKDPRQYYYSTYTLARAKQQDTAEANFQFVTNYGLFAAMPEALRSTARQLLVPLRHAAWGSNLNNTFICGYGYGAPFTQPCIYQAMDQLGIAQYLSRIGLLLGDTEALDEAKQDWMSGEAWQALRRYTEDCMVVRDPVEVFVAQNVAMDGLLYPLVYERVVDDAWSLQGGSSLALLTQFMSEWHAETRTWVDAVLKVMAAESDANRQQLDAWLQHWGTRAAAALLPMIAIALPDGQAAGGADAAMAEYRAAFQARMAKLGLNA